MMFRRQVETADGEKLAKAIQASFIERADGETLADIRKTSKYLLFKLILLVTSMKSIFLEKGEVLVKSKIAH
jgi:hypothetical protein